MRLFSGYKEMSDYSESQSLFEREMLGEEKLDDLMAEMHSLEVSDEEFSGLNKWLAVELEDFNLYNEDFKLELM
jgi:hypothetical protein